MDELARDERGHGLDDDAFITLLTRALLLAQPTQGGETEPPQGGETAVAVAANYRIGLMACPGCKKTVRTSGAEDVVVEPHVLDTAMCNAEVVSVDGEPARATQTIPRGFSAMFCSVSISAAGFLVAGTPSAISTTSTSGPRAARTTQTA